ncbi:MAG: phosphoribosylanthranilate isomerase [Bdellovibrionales bacterium]|nr:phosphoribosylanthranilate isomerase [Bdellovibrionales bacterium]
MRSAEHGRLKLKVCGMRDAANIRAVAALGPELLGFNFWPQSPRFVGFDADPSAIRELPASIGRVGVFVNCPLDDLIRCVSRFGLDWVQLHGDETVEQAAAIRGRAEGVGVIRALGIRERLPEGKLAEWSDAADMLLLDAQSPSYGGSGKRFRWELLEELRTSLPLIVAGGIGAEEVVALRKLVADDRDLWGVDVNSKCESAPGVKSVDAVRRVMEVL